MQKTDPKGSQDMRARSNWSFFGAAITLATLTAVSVAAPTTKPAAPTTLPVAKLDPKDEALTGAALALRAQQAFNRGEYAIALPLLRKMANEAADQPAKLGSIQERMRVCEKALAALKEDPQSNATAKQGQPTEETRKPHIPPKA